MGIIGLNAIGLDGNVLVKKGGGGTINNQDKSVDITENGTTEVVADGGYTGLGKVTINTEVSGGESASTIEYLDVSGGDFVEQPESKAGFIFVSSAIKIKGDDYLNIIPSAYLITAQDGLEIADVKAFKIDMNEMYLETNAEPKTIKEELEKSYGKEYLASIPRITKEQFYDLNS